MKKNNKTIFDTKYISKININTYNIFTKLKKTIKKDDKILIALSGGADSMLCSVLIINFFENNKRDLNNIFFIHLNHNTRKSNTRDSDFVSKHIPVPNLKIVINTSKLTKNENNLRKWRYSEIKKFGDSIDVDYIVFGHNLTDRIESTFLNMLRGSGLKGFQSMQYTETHHILNRKIIRPILDIPKDIIKQICTTNSIPFVEDETNGDPKTSLRNFLRLEILPQIYKLSNKNTKSQNTFIDSFSNIYKELDNLSDNKIQFELETINTPKNRKVNFAYKLHIDQKQVGQQTIVDILNQCNIYKDIKKTRIEELSNFLKNNKDGFKFFNHTYFFVSHGQIYIISAKDNFWEKSIDKKITINKLGTYSFEGYGLELIDGQHLGSTLRFANHLDTYRNKTRNKYCINQKIPIFYRNYIPIIEKDGKILQIFKNIYG